MGKIGKHCGYATKELCVGTRFCGGAQNVYFPPSIRLVPRNHREIKQSGARSAPGELWGAWAPKAVELQTMEQAGARFRLFRGSGKCSLAAAGNAAGRARGCVRGICGICTESSDPPPQTFGNHWWNCFFEQREKQTDNYYKACRFDDFEPLPQNVFKR